MTVTIITFAALLCQLYLMSYYYPEQIRARVKYVLNQYPAKTHPKLYPSAEGEIKARKGLGIFIAMTRAIGLIGFLLLITAALTGTTIVGPVVFLFAMLQFMPILVTEISEFKYYKMMRGQNSQSKRSAQIKPRHYFDYISPLKFALAVFMLLGYLAFNQYRVGFEFSIKSDGFITLAAMILVHVLFASIVSWRLHGKKLNPHQSSADREREIEGTIKSTLYVSMLMSSFLLVYGLLQHYALDHFEAVALSIYMQLCAFLSLGTMLKANKIENINFNVYRGDKSVN